MSDSREILERAARTLPEPQLNAEDVHRRRSRHQRNRRITSAVVALLVATGGTLSAFSLLGSPGRVLPAGVDAADFHALWPEFDLESALVAQARANSGDEAWRLDPEATAEHFARDVLRWPGPVAATFLVCGGMPQCESASVDRRVVQVRTETAAGPDEQRSLMLLVERLARRGDGGIWSVVQTWNVDLSADLVPGQVLEPGDRVVAATRGVDTVVAGWRSVAPCQGMSSMLFPRPVPGGHEIVVPTDIPRDCKGYVLLATGVHPDDVAAVTIGLFTDEPGPCGQSEADDGSCDPGLIRSLAATPVQFKGGGTDPDGGPGCDRPGFGPTYLPWLGDGEPVPEPGEDVIRGDNILTWEGPDGESVQLITYRQPVGTGVDVSGSIRVMGHPAWLQTIGAPPGPNTLTLNWNEAEELCRGYAIHLLNPSLSDEEAREEILNIGDSLQPDEPDSHPVFAVWPEDTAAEAEPIQQNVDDGNPEHVWRLDPDVVVERFAQEVMGRQVAEGPLYEPGHGGDDSAWFTDELGTEHVLQLAQRVHQGDGGIWSITGASSGDRLTLDEFFVGFDHDRIQGKAAPGNVVHVEIAYGRDGDEPTFSFDLTADEDGVFSADLRTIYGDELRAPTTTGHLLVGLSGGSSAGGYTAVVAMSLGEEFACYPCS